MPTAQELLNEKNRRLRNVFDGIALATRPDVVADIGAYNGDESARFRRLLPDTACHLFEANETNLSEYIAPRDDLQGVVQNFMAVADYDGEITFNVPVITGEHDKWRRLVGSLQERSDGDAVVRSTVPCTRLDTYFARELEEEKSFLLWIDVEGALDKVLAGAPKVLSRTIAVLAEVERAQFWVGQTMADDIIRTLEAADFHLVGDSYTPEATPQSDILCFNRNWLSL